MAIVAGELKLYKSALMDDSTASGGRMSNIEVVTGIKNAVFPDVSQAERTAGILHRYRKVHCKVANDDDLVLSNASIHFKGYTLGGDYLQMFLGTNTDTKSAITGSERKYGAGALKTSITAGGSSLVVTLENLNQVIFVNADKIYITNDTLEEYHDNVTISKAGSEVTITLDTGDTFTNDYTNTNTTVASVLTVASIESSCAGIDVTGTGSLIYTNEAPNIIVVDNIAGVYDVWTGIIQADLTTFTMSGVNTGAVASGSIGSDYTPPNANFSNKPYFTLKTGGWSGTPVDGDTFTLTTIPAAQGLWLDEIVPALTDPYSGNGAYIRFGGESA